QTLRRIGQVATLASALLILYATLTPSPRSPAGVPDWLAHLLLFMALGASAALWYATSEIARRSPRWALGMVICTLWLFGGLTELGQNEVPGRDPALSDWIFDVGGAIAGFLGGSAVWRIILARLRA